MIGSGILGISTLMGHEMQIGIPSTGARSNTLYSIFASSSDHQLTQRSNTLPIYTTITQEGALSDEQKQEISEAVTKNHVDATGAPSSFVNVRFFTYSAGDNFRGGVKTATAYLGGTIREGRDIATKQKMLQELVSMMQRIGKLPANEVVVYLEDINADQVTEKGAILPQPGQEDEWLKARAIANEIAAQKASPNGTVRCFSHRRTR